MLLYCANLFNLLFRWLRVLLWCAACTNKASCLYVEAWDIFAFSQEISEWLKNLCEPGFRSNIPSFHQAAHQEQLCQILAEALLPGLDE